MCVMTSSMFGEVLSAENSRSFMNPDNDILNHKTGLMEGHPQLSLKNSSNYNTENEEFIVTQIPNSAQYSQNICHDENPRSDIKPCVNSNRNDLKHQAPCHESFQPTESAVCDRPAPNCVKEANEVSETAELCKNDVQTPRGSAAIETPTVAVSNHTESSHENCAVEDNSGQIIKFEGDLRDYTFDRRSPSPHKASESRVQTRIHHSSSYEGNDQEECEEHPSSLSDALLQPPHSTRHRLKSLAMAVSRSLPSSPRFRSGQNFSNLRHSQSAFNDYWSGASRLKNKSEDARGANRDAELLLTPTSRPTFSEQEERPRSTSPTRPNTSQIAMSSVKSVKTIVTQSTSIIDVSNGISSLSQVKGQRSGRSFSSSALPRSTSTPGLSSHLTTPVLGRQGLVSSTAESMRELRGQPWSLSRAESLAELNGLQHCIVCRACSSRAKQIRPGRHFVLSWKQIIALIFALSVYIAGGTMLFIQLEYTAESKRQDSFIRFFEGFVGE